MQDEIAGILRRIAYGHVVACVTSAGLLRIKGGTTWVMAGGWMVRVEGRFDHITNITDARSPDGRGWQWSSPHDGAPLALLTQVEAELLWCRLVLLDPLPRWLFDRLPERPVPPRPNGSGIAYKPRARTTTGRRSGRETPQMTEAATPGRT